MNRIPMCWKCREAILETNDYDFNAKKIVGCKIEPRVQCYGTAKVYCPLIRDDEVEQND